jgi:hypothetical protein
LPSVKEILYHADKLFDGAMVGSKDIEDRDPEHALAWCAYAYREKSKLTGPGGLVRKRLVDNQVPPQWAQLQWQETLPAAFLEALGLIEYTCEICQAKFTMMANLDAHRATHPQRFSCPHCEQAFVVEGALDSHIAQDHKPILVAADESVSMPIREGSTMTPEQAWQSVLDLLQMQLPKAPFETWVRDTKALRYGRNVLEIGTRNAYARDWLESRLASTVERLLVGIMNTSVDVVFVAATEWR